MDYRTTIAAQDLVASGVPPDWVLIDCRFDLADQSWGESGYRQAHIPGAKYAHLDRDLSGGVTADTGRHPLPGWRQFAERLGQWGVHPNAQVMVYDQDSGGYAARLWWMLRAIGHDRVALLDGGWRAWLSAGGAEEVSVPPLRAGSYVPRPGSGWVTTAQLERELVGGACVLVDARSGARFRGEHEPIDPVAGHVPGAVNRPHTENLSPDGSFLPSTELATQWGLLLEGRAPGSVVHMCGSGVTACHNLLAMELAGLTGSRLYVGSWSEWIATRRRPVATGAG